MYPGRKTAADTTRKLVRRFYDQFWNSRNYGAAERIVGPHAIIRGTLGTTADGPRGLERYAEQFRIRALGPACGERRSRVVAGGRIEAQPSGEITE